MGYPVPLVIYVDGVRHVVGRAFWDPVGGECKGIVDVNQADLPTKVRDILWGGQRKEFSIAPLAVVPDTFDRLMTTTTTTTIVTDPEEG